RSAAHRALLCLARVALSARRRCRLRHRARLRPAALELRGRACAGLLGSDLGRHAIARVRRQPRGPPASGKHPSVVARARLPSCALRIAFRGIRESMWVNVLCTLVEASGLILVIAVGISYWGSVDYLEMPPPSGEES